MISDEVEVDATETAPKPTDQDTPPDGEVGEEDGASPVKEPDSKAPGINVQTDQPLVLMMGLSVMTEIC